MSKTKSEKKEARALAHEAKRRTKDAEAAEKASPRGAAKRAYEYMVVGGITLFFQAVILCSTGFFWSGGFLFPLAVLCWVKSRSRAFSTCLAIVGFAISTFELCDCTFSIIVLFTRSHDVTYVSQWVATIALEVLGALLAVLGIIVFPMAILRLSQATSFTSSLSDETPTIKSAEENSPVSPAIPPQPPVEHSNHTPLSGRPDMHAAQLYTDPYAQPQPILIAGHPPPPGQAGVLQPAGIAYVAFPPNGQRNAIPLQPLTGQPILAGPPVMYQQVPPRPYSPPVPYHRPFMPTAPPPQNTPQAPQLHPPINEYGQPVTYPNKNAS